MANEHIDFMLIVLEGLDGTGKGTQIKLLQEKLDAQVFKYPTAKTPEINAYLEKKMEIGRKELFHLFLKDIMAEQDEIRKKRNSNAILDRYVFSTIAYEEDAYGYEEEKQIITKMNFIKPDLVLLLDIEPKTAQTRKKMQKELDRYEEDLRYMEGVRERFLKMYEDRFLTPNWHKIDANVSIEKVHRQILDVLKL